MKQIEYRLCVVLLNYRTPKMVLDCLATLVPQIRKLQAKAIVVDNHSCDDSVEMIQRWIQTNDCTAVVEMVASDRNGGFSAGNNVGIRALTAENYLLINSDTLVRDGALAEMLMAIESDDKVGMVSPRLEWPDGTPQESCFRYHRPLSELVLSANTGLVLKLFQKFEVAKRIFNTDSDCEWTSFACVLIRKEVFDQIGLLDEKFFMYFEDVDFCYRAKQAGWAIRNHPAARVVHLRGGSSPVKANASARKRQARYYYESRTRYYYKLTGRVGLLAANLCWTVGWLFAVLRSLVQKSFQSPACELEWRDIWVNFSSPEKPYVHPKDYK